MQIYLYIQCVNFGMLVNCSKNLETLELLYLSRLPRAWSSSSRKIRRSPSSRSRPRRAPPRCPRAPQGVGGDVAKTLLVVHPECVLELPLHGLHVRVLNKESGTKLAKLPELDLTRTILVDLMQQVLQLLLCGTEAHGPHDLAEVVGGEEVLLLGVEEIKAHLQTLDLIVRKVGRVVDLLKVDISIRIGLGHLQLLLLLVLLSCFCCCCRCESRVRTPH